MKKHSELLQTINRRRFLTYCAALGAGAAAGGVLQSMYDVLRTGSRAFRVTDSRVRMGTYVSITGIHESRARVEDAVGLAFAEMDRLIAILSRHDTTTPLAVLNDHGRVTSAPAELVDVIQHAVRFHGQTRGAFDITVAPLVDLFRGCAGADRTPSEGEIRDAIGRIGLDGLRFGHPAGDSSASDITRRDVRLRPGMRLTLDGVAKGYIVDRASDVLVARGVNSHLINAGGDIRASGHRPAGRGWTIAIEDPEKKKNYTDVIRLTNGAVATSGDYEVYFDDERMFTHIVDPRLGRSPRLATSASVIADTVMRADALSTALFVMGGEQGLPLIEELPVGECLLVTEDGRRQRSRNWDAFSVERTG